MSSAPTDCRVPDPTDAKADGHFGNHRAGYGDRLDRIIATARKGWTLAAGEGLVLVQEIDRMQGAVDATLDHLSFLQDENKTLREQLRDTHTQVFHLEEKLTWVERERDQLTSLPAERILAALREPSEAVVVACAKALRQHHEGVEWCTWEALKEQTRERMMDEVRVVLSAAVAAAEREVDV